MEVRQMLLKKLDSEKLERITAGSDQFCCWGNGQGCNCTSSNGSRFKGSFDGWIKHMEQTMDVSLQ